VLQLQIRKEDVDLEVLKELPQEIRDEVIKEYNLEATVAAVAKPAPPPLKKETAAPPAKKSPFSGLQWCQLKPVLYKWMSSEPKPSEVDVNMLGEHFRQLAVDRNIEMLKVAMNFLHRTFSSLDCDWHRAYRDIVDLTQQGMVARYGATLHVNRTFPCCQVS
jgi:hypothetical protein